MESAKNPESQKEAAQQQIIAKVLVKGDRDGSSLAESVVYEVKVDESIQKQMENPLFEKILQDINKGEKKEGEIWVDAREICPNISEEQAQTLVNFINHFDADPSKLAAAFTSYQEYRKFVPIIDKLNIVQKVEGLAKLKESVQRKFPILILIDVGGSILCRTGQKLPVQRTANQGFCQIRMHYHYYRPQFETFLAQIISHPRVQLGFYTSIMRKNVMPLLFKIFDLRQLNPYRSYIFEVFDQEYNVPDLGPNKKPYATKRCLKKVLDHHKCKELGFSEKNTLMIDSDQEKVKDYKLNSILIKPYEPEDVLDDKNDHSKILTTVRDYVFELLEETDDVQDFLSKCKPAFTAWQEELASQKVPEESKEEESSLADKDSSSSTNPEQATKTVTAEAIKDIAKHMEELKVE